MKPRILIFADHFLPGYLAGGPILSLSLLHGCLADRFEPVIATRNRDFGRTEPYREVPWDRLTRHREFSVWYLSRTGMAALRKVIRETGPSAVYLNSFFSAFSRGVLLLNRLGALPCPVVLAPRGELSREALAIKGAKKSAWLAASRMLGLHRGVIFHATDRGEEADIRRLLPVEVRTLPNFSRQVEPGRFPLPRKIAGGLKVAFLSRVTEKKNLLKALSVLASGRVKGEIEFDVYGPVEDPAYWEACLAKSRELPDHVRFRYRGPVESGDVPAALSRHHVLFLPTRNENFGHVIVEAMKLGLLPVISDRTPWRKLDEFGAGWDVPLDADSAYAAALQKAADMDQEAFSAHSGRARDFIGRAIDDEGNRERYLHLFGALAGGIGGAEPGRVNHATIGRTGTKP